MCNKKETDITNCSIFTVKVLNKEQNKKLSHNLKWTLLCTCVHLENITH